MIAAVTKTNSGSHPFVAHMGATYLGTFVSVREAQRPVEAAHGHLLRWERDAASTVEVYYAYDQTHK
jgi:hypothetical protein